MTAAGCAFCAIASGKTEANFVYRDEHCVGFLDNRPLFHGHCLLVPIEHYETLPDLPLARVAALFSAVRLLTTAVPIAVGAEGAFVAINNRVSQSVPHLHVHVVPRRRKDGLKGFFWPRTSYGDESEAQATAAAIRKAVASLEGAGDD